MHLLRNVRDVVDISSGLESEYDDRRQQAVSAGSHRSARRTNRRESPPSVLQLQEYQKEQVVVALL